MTKTTWPSDAAMGFDVMSKHSDEIASSQCVRVGNSILAEVLDTDDAAGSQLVQSFSPLALQGYRCRDRGAETLASLRALLSSRLLIAPDNVEHVLCPQKPSTPKVYAAVDGSIHFSNTHFCIISRAPTIPLNCKVVKIPTLSTEAAQSHTLSRLQAPQAVQFDQQPVTVRLSFPLHHLTPDAASTGQRSQYFESVTWPITQSTNGAMKVGPICKIQLSSYPVDVVGTAISDACMQPACGSGIVYMFFITL